MTSRHVTLENVGETVQNIIPAKIITKAFFQKLTEFFSHTTFQ